MDVYILLLRFGGKEEKASSLRSSENGQAIRVRIQNWFYCRLHLLRSSDMFGTALWPSILYARRESSFHFGPWDRVRTYYLDSIRVLEFGRTYVAGWFRQWLVWERLYFENGSIPFSNHRWVLMMVRFWQWLDFDNFHFLTITLDRFWQ